MKKKLLSLALVLAMALTLLPTAALAADYTGGTVTLPTALTVKATPNSSNNADTVVVSWTAPTLALQGATDAGATFPDLGEVVTGIQVTLASGSDLVAKDNKLTKTLDGTAVTSGTNSVTFTRGTDFTTEATSELTLTATVEFTVDTSQITKGDNTFTFADPSGKTVTDNTEKYTPSPASSAQSSITVTKAEFSADMKTLTVKWTPTNVASNATYKVEISGTNPPTLTSNTTVTGTEYTMTFSGEGIPSALGSDWKITVTSNTDPAVASSATAVTKASGTTDPGDGKTTIGAFTVDPVTMFPVQAGAPVSFKIASASITEGGENKTAAIGKMTLTRASWLLHGANTSDSTGTLETAPSTPGTYAITFTATMAANDDFELAEDVLTYTTSGYEVLAVPAPETPAEKPEDTTNKAPSTNSQGIPVASEVTTPQQATQAVNTLKNTNAAVLQDRLMTNDTALSSFKSLESAVISTKHIKVEVSKESSAPSDVRTGVDIDGAAFNASSSNSTVSLVVGAPSQAYPITAGYQISMTLTGVGSASSLAVPVVITLPIPSDVKPERVVVLHYHDGSSTPSVIDPVVSGDSIRFTVTGFSDFVVTDQSIPTSRTNGGTGYLGGNLKNNQNDISDILPAIAAMLSGDGVFVDVPAEHWAAKEIRWARDGGLMSGYGNGGFGPTASTTRQQLWMVLARLSGTRPADMAMARQWAINTGVSDGSNPTGVLSRQQLVTMLYRFAKSQGKDVSASAKLSGYADSAKVASYAKEALSWAAAKGIVSGSNGKLNPEGTATRAHFAVFLYRYSNG